MWPTTLFSTANPDDTPTQSPNESSPLLHGSMKHGKRGETPSPKRARYTKLPDIEEGTPNEEGRHRTRQQTNWKKILFKGLKYVALLIFLVGVGFGAVAMAYPRIFKSGL